MTNILLLLFCLLSIIICNVKSEENDNRFNVEVKFENVEERLHRQKRQLLFPIATLLQVSFCVATQVQLTKRKFFVNNGFQLNFGLPYLLSQIPWSFLGTPPIIDVARSKSKRDIAVNFTDVTQQINTTQYEGDNFVEITSEIFYHILEKLVDSFGYNGTGCMLHSVCQLAKLPFHKDEDLLHEIVHFIMTPSEHDMPNNTENTIAQNFASTHGNNKYSFKAEITPYSEYLKAEMKGKSGANCDAVYTYCPSSPLDHLSEIAEEDDDEFSEEEKT